MSSELERRLREAGENLPEPDEAATRRARALSLSAIRRRRPRIRLAALIGVALVVALGVGAGLSTLIAPSGTAARGPVGLGFLPEPGWFVLQSGARATPSTPAIAVASNVPFDPEDDVHGLADSSGLPYASLLALPPHGVIIVASFTRRGEPRHDALFPRKTLPLHLGDATSGINYSVQVRPDEPLGQYQIRAAVNGHNVDVHIYFGVSQPSVALREGAQRQLDQLVVRSSGPGDRVTAVRPAADVTVSAPGVIDRTFLCTTAPRGGIYEIEARAHRGIRESGSKWKQLPFAVVSTGGSAGIRNSPALLGDSLAWITAGRPSVTTTIDTEWRASPAQPSGTLAVQGASCRSTTARVPLTTGELQGGVASPFGDERDCVAPRRVLVHVRATLQSQASLRSRRSFLSTNITVREARLAVRTQSGKPLVYAEVFASGKARLFVARNCVPD